MIKKWALAYVGMSFNCARCGRCCSNYPVELTYDDLVEMARTRPDIKEDLSSGLRRVFFLELGRPGWTFRPSMTDNATRQTECRFLDFKGSQSHCRIYDIRPLSCRLYPFDLMPEHVADKMGLKPTRGLHTQFYDTADGCWAYLAYDINCPGIGGGPNRLMEEDLYRIAEACNVHLGRFRRTQEYGIEDLLALLERRNG